MNQLMADPVAMGRHANKDVSEAIKSWKGFFNSRKRKRVEAQKVRLISCQTFHI